MAYTQPSVSSRDNQLQITGADQKGQDSNITISTKLGNMSKCYTFMRWAVGTSAFFITLAILGLIMFTVDEVQKLLKSSVENVAPDLWVLFAGLLLIFGVLMMFLLGFIERCQFNSRLKEVSNCLLELQQNPITEETDPALQSSVDFVNARKSQPTR